MASLLTYLRAAPPPLKDARAINRTRQMSTIATAGQAQSMLRTSAKCPAMAAAAAIAGLTR
jgi:hypothetical protein